MRLLIDDVRELPRNEIHVIARTYEAGLAILAAFNVTHLYLDHDLGTIDDTGLDLMRAADSAGCLPPNIALVTANIVGAANMEAQLKEYGYTKHDPTWWSKN
jgi:hypothetical protein